MFKKNLLIKNTQTSVLTLFSWIMHFTVASKEGLLPLSVHLILIIFYFSSKCIIFIHQKSIILRIIDENIENSTFENLLTKIIKISIDNLVPIKNCLKLRIITKRSFFQTEYKKNQ